MVKSSEFSEESGDWEVIQHPSSYQPSSPPPDGQLFGFDLVIRDDFYDDSSSIFPPSEHEDLPLLEDCSSPRIVSPSRSPSSPACSEIKSDSRLSIMMNDIRNRMYTVGKRMFQVFICSSSNRKYFSIIPATMLALALFASLRILQWRNHLVLLIRERDQRISQLLHQIAHMNEILSARRKVPVMRIN
ncbi:hypothetical protein BVRB_6g153300 [Beta vulgaris subsp. vulgaris]|uniref:uncharacterized protein LOC104897848 isoform X1 n=1 Tax=Beta vulgaris subsp. vulgaris TaxID=3555 RepID=UPI00053F2F20|nr:uncharacterized protein LOC104897848 isoform X1 [Beta vulgaris subsp. vulgaris]KMT06998.1 hypothetical protein BVRB_6g153300 [Beta vulgaris subsp. vulgaris]